MYRKIIIILPFLIFIGIKYFFTLLGNDDIVFILKPVVKIISFMKNSSYEFISGSGYYFPDFDIIVNKSCSGYTFFSLCLSLSVYQLISKADSLIRILISVVSAIIIAYFVTILANSSRILFSLYFHFNNEFFPFSKSLHYAEGVFIYLFFLISVYIIIEIILKKRFTNDKKNV